MSPGGNVQAARATQASTASVWEGYGAGSLTSKINSDGSATFAGNVQLGSNLDAGASEGALIRKNGRIQLASNQGSTPLWSGYTVGTSTATSQILANGSATFNGGIVSKQEVYVQGTTTSTQRYLNFQDAGTSNYRATLRRDAWYLGAPVTNIGDVTPSGANIVLNMNGAATFKGTVTADSTTATNGVFNGSLNGSVTSYVLANGAAAFAGGNGVSTNQSFGIDQYGRVSIREDASGLTDVFAILKGSSTTKTCTISNDGTVTAGLFAATGVNNTGVEAGSGGLLSVQRGPSSGTSDVFRGYQGATVNTRIRADGSAEFAGGNFIISSGGTILADSGGNPASAAKVNINSNGSATFAGAISVDGGTTNENSTYGPGYLVQKTEAKLLAISSLGN